MPGSRASVRGRRRAAPSRRRARRPRRSGGRASWSRTTRPSVRDLLAKTLALAEYDVDLAPDGRAAVERLRMIPYDLLITDLKMPGVDGLTVIREARRLKADIPVIIITGFSTEASAIEAANLGVVRLPHQAVPRSPRPGGRRPRSRRVAAARRPHRRDKITGLGIIARASLRPAASPACPITQ